MAPSLSQRQGGSSGAYFTTRLLHRESQLMYSKYLPNGGDVGCVKISRRFTWCDDDD